MRRVVALAVCTAVPASASAAKYPKPENCGAGEPAYTGSNYTGEAYCYTAGHVSKDLYLAGIDNSFRSIKIDGAGSALACRDRNFRSYCKILNASHPHLDELLSGAITSIHVY